MFSRGAHPRGSRDHDRDDPPGLIKTAEGGKLLGYPAGIALALACDPQEAGHTVVERYSFDLVRYLSGKSGAVKPIDDKTRSDKDRRDARDVAGEFFVGGRRAGYALAFCVGRRWPRRPRGSAPASMRANAW
jgi:hypothetical protein